METDKRLKERKDMETKEMEEMEMAEGQKKKLFLQKT